MAAYATSAPLPSGEMSNAPPICQNCKTSTTPLWRRDDSGSVLCNACGLFLKLHNRPRPISLRTNVIKSRNRARPQNGGVKRVHSGGPVQGLAAAHPDVAHGVHSQRQGGQLQIVENTDARDENGNSFIQHPNNIAPQSMFDTYTVDGQLFQQTAQSPSLQPVNSVRLGSPGSSSSATGGGLEQLSLQTYEALLNSNTSLKTRVSELEVINDLFRGRVQELEQSEQEARRNETNACAREARLRLDLQESGRKIESLVSRLKDFGVETDHADISKSRDRLDRPANVVVGEDSAILADHNVTESMTESS